MSVPNGDCGWKPSFSNSPSTMSVCFTGSRCILCEYSVNRIKNCISPNGFTYDDKIPSSLVWSAASPFHLPILPHSVPQKTIDSFSMRTHAHSDSLEESALQYFHFIKYCLTCPSTNCICVFRMYLSLFIVICEYCI